VRGADVMQEGLFSFKRLEEFVPTEHPLRGIRTILNAALARLDAQFDDMYAPNGRDSIAPEKLLRALILQTLYSIRSERALCEHLGYWWQPLGSCHNLLYRWFVGLAIDSEVWDHSSFTRNRDRLIAHDAVKCLFGEILGAADAAGLLSDEHFSVDGTLLRAWASHKSMVPRDGGEGPPKSGSKSNPEVDFKGIPRSNDTHVSATDPEAMLATKSNREGAKLAYTGHVLMENRNGLAVDCMVTQATGTAEREAALMMLANAPEARTVGTDKAYDTADFVAGCRDLGVTPHVAQNTQRRGGSAIDGRTTRHVGYTISQTIRKRIENLFGDGKQHRGLLRQLKVRGVGKANFVMTLTMSVTNLVRMAKLMTARMPGMTLTG
jgi:transposase